MKIAFGIIVFNGNNTLELSLKTIYPYASQILIAEGPVGFWQKQGYTRSIDGTAEMIDNFPDPDNKIKVVHGQYTEKLQQTNAYIPYMNEDTDYLWNLDSDQVFKPQDIEMLIQMLENPRGKPFTHVKFKSVTFYGGFDRYMTGFEEKAKFPGLFRVYPGSRWNMHRYPKMSHKDPLPNRILDSEGLAGKGMRMYHYSYVFADHVYQKARYYTEFLGPSMAKKIKKKRRVDTIKPGSVFVTDWFRRVWIPWVRGNETQRKAIEDKFGGVHELTKAKSYTAKFTGEHPKIIQANMDKLTKRFNDQLRKYSPSKGKRRGRIGRKPGKGR